MTVKYFNVEIPEGFERLARIVIESHLLGYDPTGQLGMFTDGRVVSAIDQMNAAAFQVRQKHDSTDPEFVAFLYRLKAQAYDEMSKQRKQHDDSG
jgi:hypothetical protein